MGINICMEYMDGGSLDLVIKKAGKIGEKYLKKITQAVLRGLSYLAQIFGSTFTEDPANMVPPVPSPRTPRTPLGSSKPMAIFELLEYIVNQPPPRLPSRVFSNEMRNFVDICLRKKPEERPDLTTLMSHPWLANVEGDNTDVARWVQEVIRLPTPALGPQQ